MTIKKIIAHLNKGEKFYGDNYDILHQKVVFILTVQEVIKPLNKYHKWNTK